MATSLPLDQVAKYCLPALRAARAVISEGLVEDVPDGYGGHRKAIAAVVVIDGQRWAVTAWDEDYCLLAWDFVPA